LIPQPPPVLDKGQTGHGDEKIDGTIQVTNSCVVFHPEYCIQRFSVVQTWPPKIQKNCILLSYGEILDSMDEFQVPNSENSGVYPYMSAAAPGDHFEATE
jgi:hypothetical protein